MVFGSHLYGLNNENSDMDYKGIFLPDVRDLVLQRAPKSINHTTGDNFSKNGAGDVDEEFYSLHYFLELALKGETVALDMLHSDVPLESSKEWKFLVEHRKMFYTKNLKAFMGYLKRQVAKYSVKGSRLADIERVLVGLRALQGHGLLLKDIWLDLPEGEYIKKVEQNNVTGVTQHFYEVNQKKYQSTNEVDYVIERLERMYDAYGARAKLAKDNNGIDWKAVSHALRAGYQLRDIYLDGDFEYPLKETDFIKKVKQGEYDFVDHVQPILEALMEQVEELADKSNLPVQPNRKFWDEWLLGVYGIAGQKDD